MLGSRGACERKVRSSPRSNYVMRAIDSFEAFCPASSARASGRRSPAGAVASSPARAGKGPELVGMCGLSGHHCFPSSSYSPFLWSVMVSVIPAPGFDLYQAPLPPEGQLPT